MCHAAIDVNGGTEGIRNLAARLGIPTCVRHLGLDDLTDTTVAVSAGLLMLTQYGATFSILLTGRVENQELGFRLSGRC